MTQFAPGELLKLIWDFRGPDAQKTAEHQAIHLKEFCVRENIEFNAVGSDPLTDMHTIAYLIVDPLLMIQLRDSLRPHRAAKALV